MVTCASYPNALPLKGFETEVQPVVRVPSLLASIVGPSGMRAEEARPSEPETTWYRR